MLSFDVGNDIADLFVVRWYEFFIHSMLATTSYTKKSAGGSFFSESGGNRVCPWVTVINHEIFSKSTQGGWLARFVFEGPQGHADQRGRLREWRSLRLSRRMRQGV